MKKKTIEKIMALLSVILLLGVLVTALWLPVVYREDKTEYYNLYKELETYTNTPALEEYLEDKEIRYTKTIGDIYVHCYNVNLANKKDTIHFITLRDNCEIVEEKYVTNFKRLDDKENVEIVQKEGKPEISFEEDGKRYILYDGHYYTKPVYAIGFNIVRIFASIFVLVVCILIIYAFFFTDIGF